MRIIILSLCEVNERPIISIDLTGRLVDFDNHNSNELIIELPTGTIKLNKWHYLNKYKIYEDKKDPKCFFVVGNYKSINHKNAFNVLMEHSLKKIDTRIRNLECLKSKYRAICA